MIHVVGAGLAGSEIAFQLSNRGYDVFLHEMRPTVESGVHKSDKFAELVCSNSLKSLDASRNASGLLKKELEKLGSFVLKVARKHSIPGGRALVVDREAFSEEITETLESSPHVVVRREEVKSIPQDEDIWVIASGPATSDELYKWLEREFGKGAHFFDAVSPVVSAESIDMSKAFFANRYEEGKDYLNCPMEKKEYIAFREALVHAEVLPIEGFDRKLLFSRCQPIEEIARSGLDAMRYGPLRPVGLSKNGKKYYAVVQLRRDNSVGSLYNLVGFQTRLKWPEQERIIHMIPGLERAKVVRYGVMHANVYLEPFEIMDGYFRAKKDKRIFFAGQITGVEGYVESVASGLFVALNLMRILNGKKPITLPKKTMIGALLDYVSRTPDLKPMYANFGLLKKDEVEELPSFEELLLED